MEGVRERGFSRRDTDICKGAAVILLLMHHLFSGSLPSPVPLLGGDTRRVIATLAKVCVSVFMVLSGYGLALSYERREREGDLRFTLRHLKSLMLPYWLVYAVFTGLSFFLAYPGWSAPEVYGTGPRAVWQAIVDMLGLFPLFGTSTMCQTWWYMEAAIVMYAAFPLIYRAVRRAPAIALPMAAAPVAYYFLRLNNIASGCREIYWFFAFSVGVFLAQRGLLDRWASRAGERRALCVGASGAAVLAMVYVRAKLGMAFDTPFALAIILFLRAAVCGVPGVSGALEHIGRHSGDIFMLHSFLYYYFISRDIFDELLHRSEVTAWAALALLLAGSLVCAWLLELARRGIGAAVKRARQSA